MSGICKWVAFANDSYTGFPSALFFTQHSCLLQQFYQLKCQRNNSKIITSYDLIIQGWLNQGPTAPFTCPLLWIPTPFGMIEGGRPTVAEGYNPWLWGRVWGLKCGLPAGLPLRCWRAWICLRPSSWIRDIVSNSFIDRASRPAPYNGACRDISSLSEASALRIYCCKRKTRY